MNRKVRVKNINYDSLHSLYSLVFKICVNLCKSVDKKLNSDTAGGTPKI